MKTIIHTIQRQAIGRMVRYKSNFYRVKWPVNGHRLAPCFKVVAEPMEKEELPAITIDSRFIGKAKYRI